VRRCSGESSKHVPGTWYQEHMTSQQDASTSSAGNRNQHDNNSKGRAHYAYQHSVGNGSGNNGTQEKKFNDWILDTGATDHMTFNKNDLINSKIPKKNGIINANGVCYPVNMAGDVKNFPNLTLQDTLFVPSLSSKLVLVGKLIKDLKCTVHIFPDHCIFQDIQTKRVLGHGTRRGGLYYLDGPKIGKALLNNGLDGREIEILVWHKRLGHPSLGYMKKRCPQLFNKYDYDRLICETCIKAKSHRSSYLPSSSKALAPFDLVHTDLWGPSLIYSKAGYRWYIIFVDDFSRMTWLYLLKTKEEVKDIFKIFITMVKTQFERNIKVLRSDNGT
jgi:GAG-pre-integrase domain